MGKFSLEETVKYNKSGPARYCCRTDVWKEAAMILPSFGKRAVVSGGTRSRASIREKLFPALDTAGIQYVVNGFSGESSMNNVKKILDLCEEFKPEFIIGTGGGKSIDTAKYAAELYNIPIVTVPTIAATCAASSNQIIVYSDEGEYLENIYPKTNPPLVLVDPEVIVDSPQGYFISGIYDSLAKWYEGSASLPGSDNSDIFDHMALAVAGMLKAQMYEKAVSAVRSMKEKTVTQDFIDVVNLNIYTASTVQALGIKAVRNGIAHSVQNGLTLLEGSHDVTHGEKVAYGIGVQLMVLESPREELEELFGFYRSLELTPTFKGLNLEFTDDNIKKVAHKAVNDVLMRAKPFDVISEEMMCSAIHKLENYC
ncbi:iron-containing alcohol dehydrogenase family protein [Enterocloster sp. OA13]|uniref:Iron-containing alcohol dehydrogenase family protein n=1 Tax=Enterocloster hominis (ex Hitch et al. 2024) TaxID=1917870 RepID=A0ABV1DE23_9FIRM|nr:iron-containing alcohol dehydrogenase [Lachnoclostridium pacaense]EEQ59682.1 alcohol dehydrogenase, iron-dependent [Clostridiales bacterium 1_7_47FAA]MCC2876435.1 iron-containing alcohol dehydrogenase family protein [Lachnoclostridium pacaense]MCD8169167.1 iron-containing alcohol dehydrogenase family protein [Clostridiales bacterium]MCH1948061.1 iron-containing alcohol dehydrogenase family protein [Enterocloster sp. OA13]